MPDQTHRFGPPSFWVGTAAIAVTGIGFPLAYLAFQLSDSSPSGSTFIWTLCVIAAITTVGLTLASYPRYGKKLTITDDRVVVSRRSKTILSQPLSQISGIVACIQPDNKPYSWTISFYDGTNLTVTHDIENPAALDQRLQNVYGRQLDTVPYTRFDYIGSD